MKKIFISLNDKGGVGKTTVSLGLAQVAAYRGLDFEYLELDNSNNTTTSLENSKIFQNRMQSFKTSKAQEELFKATFKAIKENKVIFIDVGGSSDSLEVTSLLKEEFAHHDIAFILPFENSIKQMANLVNTYNFIDNPENTYLVKNKVINSKNEKDPYIFFEGDKNKGIESYRKLLKPINKVFEVYLNADMQIPEITKECMLDLADLAMSFTRPQAEVAFMKEAKDMNEYTELMQKYSKSESSLKEILRLNEEFKELFDE
ncbi:MAG: AAA family ATPase [Arcobacteraceae bacterium]|nr:AAA family ATPase [Arcobacteraceae bacterium]